MNTTFTVRLQGRSAELLDTLLKEGYSASKTEAVRTALIFYAMEMGLLSSKQLHRLALKAVSESGKKHTDEEIRACIQDARGK